MGAKALQAMYVGVEVGATWAVQVVYTVLNVAFEEAVVYSSLERKEKNGFTRECDALVVDGIDDIML